MRFLLLLAGFLLTSVLTAQPPGQEYVDVVYLRSGNQLEGTVLEYVHDKRVTLVLENGSVREVEWSEMRRVGFRLDRSRLERARREADEDYVPEPAEATATEEEFRPRRTQTYHQLTAAINLGQGTPSQFGVVTTVIGGAFAYHLLRDVGDFRIGGGLDLALMSESRGENVVAVTGQAEYALLPSRRVRPLLRFEAGPALPFANPGTGNEIRDRQLSFLVHPSLGLDIQPRNGGWGGLVFDVGYRFMDSSFTVVTPNLDELVRTVSYRRLFLRGGLRF